MDKDLLLHDLALTAARELTPKKSNDKIDEYTVELAKNYQEALETLSKLKNNMLIENILRKYKKN